MKLLAIDMDGTLLNSKGHVSSENRQALSNFITHAAGAIVICSARPLNTLLKLLDTEQVLPLVRYVAGFNGSQIFDCMENRLLFERMMTRTEVRDVDKAVKISQYDHHFFTDKKIMHRTDKPVSQYSRYEADVFGLPLEIYSLTEIYNATDIFKITLCDDKFSVPLLQKTIEHHLPVGLTCMVTGTNYIDIQPAGIDKGSVVEQIKTLLKLPVEEVIAIGDQQNDMPMLNAAGTKVAMGNAVKMLQQVADVVTLDNDQHGVAYAIKQLI
ncbi:Cof-type HAD-IIB family hydrolase [Klebsiella michiganensis]|uniref:Cof-type HAD-IIB family hydrolase n=1 Tax=Klebsiella michiganensis TaxID=1134687 RepID=UPI001CCDF8CA|nr:Cof-type HAD-IIB family hydrolase [Klebsiella michiganensis]MBZ6861457.1 HAD family phosphatase [Klebsiella michiganensis]MBZ7423186.1 HAD family phosphatase [Klebsiella michiganensis]